MSELGLQPPLQDDYLAFCRGLRALAGIDLDCYRRAQMERRVRSFARQRGLPTLSDYLALLREDAGELERFVDRLTINVSELWRNPEQWALLAREVLPALAVRGAIRAWSAGASYGAEAFTLAAVAREAAPGCALHIVGTDIDRRAIEQAREGRFSAADAREADPRCLRRWFEPDGDGWRARPELRALVRFEVADLLTMPVPRAAYDLVLCRNVVIYLAPEVARELHRRLAASLGAGGYLLVGSTERIPLPGELGLEATHPFIYRRV